MDIKEIQQIKGIKLLFAYENRICAVWALNPKGSIRQTIEKLKVEARNYSDKLWDLPEVDHGGGRIKYFLGRKTESGKEEILKERNAAGVEQNLQDYHVKDGDLLTIIKRTVVG